MSTWVFSTLYSPTNILKVATHLTEQKSRMVPTLVVVVVVVISLVLKRYSKNPNLKSKIHHIKIS